jgi:hypothetical protein
MSSQGDYSGVTPADGDVERICDKIYDALEGEDVTHVLSALEAHFIFCMSLVSPEQRRGIARELKRGIPSMLEAANADAEKNRRANRRACH